MMPGRCLAQGGAADGDLVLREIQLGMNSPPCSTPFNGALAALRRVSLAFSIHDEECEGLVSLRESFATCSALRRITDVTLCTDNILLATCLATSLSDLAMHLNTEEIYIEWADHVCLGILRLMDQRRRLIMPLIEATVKVLTMEKGEVTVVPLATHERIGEICFKCSLSTDPLLQFWGGSLAEAAVKCLISLCVTDSPWMVQALRSVSLSQNGSSILDCDILWQWLRVARIVPESWAEAGQCKISFMRQACDLRLGLDLFQPQPNPLRDECALLATSGQLKWHMVARESILLALQSMQCYGISTSALSLVRVEGAETPMRLVQLFLSQDDMLVLCLWMAFTIYARQSHHSQEVHDLLHPAILACRLMQLIAFDHTILLDWIISPETVCLQYLLKLAAFLGQNTGDIRLHCKLVMDNGQELIEGLIRTLKDLASVARKLFERNLFPYNPTALLRHIDAIGAENVPLAHDY
jgi:hypothetical protein